MSLKSFLNKRSLIDFTNAFYTFSLTTNNIICTSLKCISISVEQLYVDKSYSGLFLYVGIDGSIRYSDIKPIIDNHEQRTYKLEPIIDNHEQRIYELEQIIKNLLNR